MKLTATPFDPVSGELLPVYRDAYLRGDLARTSAQAVEAYLQRDAAQAHGTVTRWHELQTTGAEPVAAAPSWVRQQLRFIQAEPRRFRQRAAAFVGVAALLAGVSMASTMRPATTLPVKVPVLSVPVAGTPLAEPTLARTVLVHGRVLNEKGQPLAGATVLRKGTALGVSTDAAGNYALRVPADGSATLQYGYGGYNEQELPARQAGTTAAVTLQPRAGKHRHWLFF